MSARVAIVIDVVDQSESRWEEGEEAGKSFFALCR